MTPDQIATKADVDAVLKKLNEVERMLMSVSISQIDEWLSIPKAAARLACSESTIRRKINQGELEAKGSGKARRVRL